MNWLDVVLLAILVASVAMSLRKGFSREVIGLVSVVLAILLGIWFYGTAGSFLIPYLNSRGVANFLGFLLVFCGVMLVGSLVSHVVGKFLKVTGLSIVDHLLGAGFGAVRGILISAALIMAIMAFSQGDKPPFSVVHSRTAPYVMYGARVLAAMAPHEVKEGFQRTYGEVKTAWGKTLEQGIGSVPNAQKGKE